MTLPVSCVYTIHSDKSNKWFGQSNWWKAKESWRRSGRPYDLEVRKEDRIGRVK